VQVFVQGKILGIDAFMREAGADDGAFAGRSLYVSLLAEILPRTLLDQLKLSRMLLGSSGGGQFLVVLPSESMGEAEQFFHFVNERLAAGCEQPLRVVWASTENLGDWSDVRKRLNESMDRKLGILPDLSPAATFQPFVPRSTGVANDYFRSGIFGKLRSAKRAGWDPDALGLIVLDGGSPSWPLHDTPGEEALPIAAHLAPGDSENDAASTAMLGRRSAGIPLWGVLRGDVDNFGARLRRATTVEEHVQFSVFFKQFFAGELQVACSMGEFWQRVSVLYSGGDDFAVYGSWDALIPFAREFQRLFARSVDEFLKEYPGPEGKTISMAIAVAASAEQPLVEVYEEAGRQLEITKSLGKDTISVLGRTLEWKQLTEAAEIKDSMLRLIAEFNCSPQFLSELASFYRETDLGLAVRTTRSRMERFDRPWRFHRRLSRLLEGPSRDREFQKARAGLLGEFIGKNQAHVKLRPSGRVALEWARFMSQAE